MHRLGMNDQINRYPLLYIDDCIGDPQVHGVFFRKTFRQKIILSDDEKIDIAFRAWLTIGVRTEEDNPVSDRPRNVVYLFTSDLCGLLRPPQGRCLLVAVITARPLWAFGVGSEPSFARSLRSLKSQRKTWSRDCCAIIKPFRQKINRLRSFFTTWGPPQGRCLLVYFRPLWAFGSDQANRPFPGQNQSKTTGVYALKALFQHRNQNHLSPIR